MQTRTFITLISVASLLALAAVLIFSWTQVTQAQARGQQNANRAPADGGRGIVNGGAETNSESVPAPPGWKPCPRCQNNSDRRRDNIKYKVEGHPFDSHDFSGVWGWNDTGKLGKPPALTAYFPSAAGHIRTRWSSQNAGSA